MSRPPADDPATVVVRLRLTHDQARALSRLAREMRLPRSVLVRAALVDYCEEIGAPRLFRPSATCSTQGFS